MSLKRILGTVLASRMAGRGRRRGGGLSGAMLGGLGYRRRPALRGKAGLAALGFMAYRAYQDHQARNPAPQGQSTGAAETSHARSTSASGGGIGGMVQNLMNTISGATSSDAPSSGTTSSGTASRTPAAPTSALSSPTAGDTAEVSEAELREDERAAENLSDEKALLLLRAMITAAHADGTLSSEERQRIMSEIDEAGGDAEDRRVMEQEIADPKPLDELLRDVNDPATAEEFYLASCAAVDGETAANRSYLDTLRERLGLSREDATEVEELTA